MVRIITAVMLITLICTFTPAVHAQNQLDPKPLNPETDPDIDMFMCSWKESIPFNTHGRLVERTIFTPHDGDQLHPQKRGAVLSFIKRFSRAHLGADSLEHLNMPNLVKAVGLPKNNFCTACFDAQYPIAIPKDIKLSKSLLEPEHVEQV